MKRAFTKGRYKEAENPRRNCTCCATVREILIGHARNVSPPEAREVDDVVARYGAGVETDLGCHNMLRLSYTIWCT